MREYAVIIEKGQDCWGAYAPDLPGLGVVGETAEEAEALIREGVVFHLEGLLIHGDPIPEPTTLVKSVQTNVVETWPHQLAKTA